MKLCNFMPVFNARLAMERYTLLLLTYLFTFLVAKAQTFQYLELPNRERLSSERVLQVVQDSEGFLWYATEGGGVCRDDGRDMDVFRSDAAHPNLLSSNNVGCLAEVGRHMMIGTFHGIDVLDKRDYSICHLAEVDDKRIDDVLVTRGGIVFLTANKKIYEFSYHQENESAPFELLHTYPSLWKGRDCYVSHLYEDLQGRVWATQWDGGLLCKDGSSFREAAWMQDVPPSDIADDGCPDSLWVGTVGRGVVRYSVADGAVALQPATGNAICIDLQLSTAEGLLWMTTIDNLSLFRVGQQLVSLPSEIFLPAGQKVLNRLSFTAQGQLLVAGSSPSAFAVGKPLPVWYDGTLSDGHVRWEYRERQGLVVSDVLTRSENVIHSDGLPFLPLMTKRSGGGIWVTDGQKLFRCFTDSVVPVAQFSHRPSAMTDDGHGALWFSTGKEIRRVRLDNGSEETVISDLPDISALSFTPDGTLWLGSIFGKLFAYTQGQLTSDEYAENEYGDGLQNMVTDSLGRLVLVYDRYVRIYDTSAHTLQQQSRAANTVYRIELQPTAPFEHWSSPAREIVVERLPHWFTAWWMWCVYALFIVFLVSLIVYNYVLRRQRHRFLEQMRALDKPATVESSLADSDSSVEEKAPARESAQESALLKKAIAQVEKNLSNEQYTVEDLSRDLCMSRMTFYRKIQSLTGQKPTEFIRTIRLRYAAKLLREGKLTVTEVSYATGFSSVSYFSRCFRTMFGMSPTQFAGKSDLAEPESLITMG